MDFDARISGRLLRAARAMTRMDVEAFSKALDVGAATLKRVEADASVRATTVAKMLARLPKVGIAVVEADADRGTGPGIAMLPTLAEELGGDPDQRGTA